MSEAGCQLPGSLSGGEEEAVAAMLAMKRIAVVGMSEDPSRAAYYVPEYLMRHGKQIVPVNPKYPQVLGQACYPALKDVPGPIDMVLVFRRPEHCAGVAREAAAAGAKGLWLQLGIADDEARRIARDAGMLYVENRCMMVEMRRR